MDNTIIRRAQESDLPTLGRLGASLMRAHFAFDPQRFMSPGENPEKGYEWFLRSQLREERAVVLVAEQEGRVVGYVYAALEPQSWKEFREPAGFIHDVAVVETQRHGGIGQALVEAACEWLRAQGAPPVILWTAEPNLVAQRLFSRLGFRRTMIEMTMELSRPA
jgi:ribosomal protein S18 acetylase RimI-like enzyme